MYLSVFGIMLSACRSSASSLEIRRAAQSARLNCTNLTHFLLTAGRFRGNSCIVMLWVAHELLQFAATQ